MLKRLFVVAVAAAAVSVPFAGAAAADTGNGLGAGGIPGHTGEVIGAVNPDYNPDGGPLPPGEVTSGVAQQDGNTPGAFGESLDGFFGGAGIPTDYGPTPPGLGLKVFTPGCGHGAHATDTAGTIPDDACY
ncbi:hypothetical protein GIY30_02510 [Gordonia sp. HNM0687]|uniref:Uncharacterized protein n=1 Tax=Gordonia mangrovi TaxID=2665643 RepID=A0A6L7GJY9_9ACTN|nr:hypothetical protein [Gordonia mangrovi]MXP20239.1 hypothetical protein [Gordonia mangrovi]UVF79151.1 hypothetical protein NWF22_04715 [Gordonia mangrovi]